MPKVRILLGTVDIGYRLPAYTRFIRSNAGLDVDVTSMVVYRPPNHHFRAEYDYEFDYFARPTLVRWCLTAWNFVRFAPRNDVFLFLSGETLLPRRLRRLELGLYRLLGKRVAMSFVGSDIRSEQFLRWRGRTTPVRPRPMPFRCQSLGSGN